MVPLAPLALPMVRHLVLPMVPLATDTVQSSMVASGINRTIMMQSLEFLSYLFK